MKVQRVPRPILMAGGSFLLAGCLLATGVAGVHAQLASCRSDPLITLSNGAQVTLYEDIYDSATDVTGITYQLHVPAGVKVKSITYSGAISSSLQTIAITADENPGNYDAYTVVSTKTSSYTVTAYMSGTNNGTTSVSCQTNGHNGQQLHSHLHLS